ERSRGSRRQPSCWRQGGHWCPGRASLTFAESLHVRFISRDPVRDFFARELAGIARFGGLRPQTRRQEQQQLLLLLRRQGVGGSFDFGKRAHRTIVPYILPQDKGAAARSASRRGLLWNEQRSPA